MSNNGEEVAALMVQASSALKAIHETQNANDDDRRVAQESYRDVLRLIARHAIASYEGRTAALTGLIVELREVTQAIKIKNPIQKHLDLITTIGDKAADLFKQEKKVG